MIVDSVMNQMKVLKHVVQSQMTIKTQVLRRKLIVNMDIVKVSLIGAH